MIFLIALEKYETLKDKKYVQKYSTLNFISFLEPVIKLLLMENNLVIYLYFKTFSSSYQIVDIFGCFLFDNISPHKHCFIFFWYENNTCVDFCHQMKSTFVLKIVIKEDDKWDIRRSYFVF